MGKTIQIIRQAVNGGQLPQNSTPAMVNKILGINWAGTFLPKHRKGNPSKTTELFVRIDGDKALYQLISD